MDSSGGRGAAERMAGGKCDNALYTTPYVPPVGAEFPWLKNVLPAGVLLMTHVVYRNDTWNVFASLKLDCAIVDHYPELQFWSPSIYANIFPQRYPKLHSRACSRSSCMNTVYFIDQAKPAYSTFFSAEGP